MLQIPGGVTDRRRTTDGQCNPALLHPQIGYILGNLKQGSLFLITMNAQVMSCLPYLADDVLQWEEHMFQGHRHYRPY